MFEGKNEKIRNNFSDWLMNLEAHVRALNVGRRRYNATRSVVSLSIFDGIPRLRYAAFAFLYIPIA